jgi:UDP-glucose-4-epimerase GalE
VKAVIEKILVIGGAGYIGSNACKGIRESGREPIVFDNLSSGHRHAVKWGNLIEGDIRNEREIRAALETVRPDAVMHFAANIEVGQGEQEPGLFYENNVAGTLNVLRAMLDLELQNFIFSSTCAIYGDPEALPLVEDMPKRPVSVYGRSKLMVETILEDMSRAKGLRYAALRYFNAAGAALDGDVGEEHDPETHLIPNALKAAAGLGQGMKLFGDDYPTPDGTCVRDYVHVADLVSAHILAAEHIDQTGESLQLNLGTGNGFTVKQVLDAVERAVGKPVPVEISPRRPGDAIALFADTSKSKSVLGWEPKHSDMDTIVSSAWNFHKRAWNI